MCPCLVSNRSSISLFLFSLWLLIGSLLFSLIHWWFFYFGGSLGECVWMGFIFLITFFSSSSFNLSLNSSIRKHCWNHCLTNQSFSCSLPLFKFSTTHIFLFDKVNISHSLFIRFKGGNIYIYRIFRESYVDVLLFAFQLTNW